MGPSLSHVLRKRSFRRGRRNFVPPRAGARDYEDGVRKSSSALRTSWITGAQSRSAPWRKIRIEGYHGLSGRSLSQRQQPSKRESSQVGLPMPPASQPQTYAAAPPVAADPAPAYSYYPGYAYYPAPYYYAPYPYYYGPTVGVGVGFRFGGGHHHHW